MTLFIVVCVGLGSLAPESVAAPARPVLPSMSPSASVARLLRRSNSLGDSVWCVEAKRLAESIGARKTADARVAVRSLLIAQRSRKLDLGIVGSVDVAIRRRLVESLIADRAESDVDRRAELAEIAKFLGDARRELATPFDLSDCHGISAGIGGGGPGSSPEVRAHVARYMAQLAAEIRKRNRACEMMERRGSLDQAIWELKYAIVGCIARRLTPEERHGSLAGELIRVGALNMEEQSQVRAGK
jgi:hypothetical protein